MPNSTLIRIGKLKYAEVDVERDDLDPLLILTTATDDSDTQARFLLAPYAAAELEQTCHLHEFMYGANQAVHNPTDILEAAEKIGPDELLMLGQPVAEGDPCVRDASQSQAPS